MENSRIKAVISRRGEVTSFVLKITGRFCESDFVQNIRLTADSRRLVFDTEVDWRELHRLLKVSFPVEVYAENGINEMQFGYVERPTHRSRLYDKDRFEVCNHRYSALCDGSHGAAVLNDCKYGICMNGIPVRLDILRLLYMESLSIVEISEKLCIAPSSAALHVKMLEVAGLINAEV